MGYVFSDQAVTLERGTDSLILSYK